MESIPEDERQCTQLRLHRLVISHAIHLGSNFVFITSNKSIDLTNSSLNRRFNKINYTKTDFDKANNLKNSDLFEKDRDEIWHTLNPIGFFVYQILKEEAGL